MFKQTVMAIKEIMQKYIFQIQATPIIRACIKEIWTIFQKKKSPTKTLLKDIFDENPNLKKLESQGFKSVISKYKSDEVVESLREMKEEMIFRMK